MVRRCSLARVTGRSAKGPPTPASQKRRLARALAIFGGLIALLLLALHSGPARKLALDRVTALLASRQMELTAESIRYNLFTLSLDARNLRLRAAGATDLPAFATVGRVRLDLSLADLFRGRYVVQSGAIDDVDVHYVLTADGRDNVPRPPPDPGGTGTPIDYFVTSLSIPRAKVRYEDRARQIDLVLALSPIDMTGNAMTGRHRLRAASTGEVRIGNRGDTIDQLTIALDLGRDDVRIDRLQLEAAGSRITVAGRVQNFDAPFLGLELQATVEAARTAALLAVRERIEGIVTVTGTARGPLASPAIVATVAGSDLQVRSLGGARVNAQVAYDAAARRVQLSSGRLQAPWGRLSAKGALALDHEHRSRVQADIGGLDAAAVMRGLKLPSVVETSVDGELDAEWPGLAYAEASGAASATLTATSTRAARGTIPLSGRFSARGTKGAMVAELQDVTAAGVALGGRVEIDRESRLGGRLHVAARDVGVTAATAEIFLGRTPGSLLPAAVAGAMDIDARLGGAVEAPSALMRVSAPSLAVGATNGIDVAADLSVTPSVLTIADGTATWNGARAGLKGTIELKDRRRLDLAFDGATRDLGRLIPADQLRAGSVTGAVSARGVVRGTLANPLGTLSLQGDGLSAFGEQVGSLTADAVLAGSEITLSRLVIDKPQPGVPGRITASGSYHLDRKRYTLDVKSEHVRLLNLDLSGGRRVRGEVQVSAKGAGTVSSPSGTLDLVFDSLEIDGLQEDVTPLGRIAVAASAANRQAHVTATADRFALDARADVGLARPWPAIATVRVSDLDLERLPVAVGTVAGRLRATVNATGDLADPVRGKSTATIEGLAGTWNGQPFSVIGPGELRYSDRRLAIARLELTALDSSLVVKGELPLTDDAGTGDVGFEARASLATLTRLLTTDPKITAEGAATLSGSVRGTVKSIVPDLLLKVDDATISAPQLGPAASAIHLRARVAGGAAAIEQLSGRWGAATFEASGTFPLAALPPLPFAIPHQDGPATLKATLRDLDLAAIPGLPAGLTGRVAVDVDASASRADLGALEGHIAFPQLELGFNRLTLAQQEPSRISVGSGVATVERLALSGSAGRVTAGGTVGLSGARPLDMSVDGSLNVAALSVLSTTIRTDGTATWKVAAQGPLMTPQLNGSLDLADVTLASDPLAIAAVHVNAHVNLAGTRVELTTLSGEVNGGALTGSGSATFANATIGDIDLQVSATDFAYDAPLDLRSLSDASMRVSRRAEEVLIAGQVTIKEAGLTADINFDEGLFGEIDAPRTLDLTEVRNPFLDRVRFSIDVDTATPVAIENNLARAEIEADLRIVGSPYEPGLTGRLTLLEGGELTLNARRYEVERGIITFVDERRIFPSVDLALNTKASNYDVRISVSGTPGRTETTWTSEPPLPEPDIMALVVTGRTVDQMRGEESEVARVQALTYLTGRVGSKFGRRLERATGLSEVRIEPVLIANETDPTARLTVGQNVTDQVKLVYSTNLADSDDQIWVVEYDVTRRFQMRGVREREDDSGRFDFRHDVRFGGAPAPRRQLRHQPTITSLTLAADPGADEARLRDLFKLKEGDTYDFFRARGGLARIEQHFLETGYLQARVRLDREIDNDRARLTLRVTAGPPVELQFDGPEPPSKIQRAVRAAWHHGVFDRQRGNDSVRVLRDWLIVDEHLQPQVDYTLQDNGPRRRVVFRIAPGPRYDRVVLAFDGASGISPDRLDRFVGDQRLERALFTDPSLVTNLLERFCRDQGYLAAEIDEPRYEFHGTTARVVVPVREGPRFTVKQVTITGNTIYPSSEIEAKVQIAPGAPFVPAAAAHALDRIRDLYWRKGYNDMRSEYGLAVDRNAGTVDVAFTVAEGRQSVVSEIAVTGNRKTSERLVRREVELVPLQPLDLAVLAKSRQNLYGTGAFSIADITREEVVAEPNQTVGEKPVRLTVSVREVQPVQLRYGMSYDTEGGIGGILDFSIHNSLGRARVFGFQGRYDSEIHEGRLYVSQPTLRSWPRKTIASIYFREDLNPPTDETDPFDISRQGASIQQEAHFRKIYVWSYGYRYELATTLEPSLGEGATETVRVTPFSTTLTRETRDEVLDASKGTFLSQAFAYSPGWLGSDEPYAKYYGQYFRYFPLRPERTKPFSTEILRPRLVFATGVRVGLARGLGGDVPTSERFYAGGSTTMRGFEQNAVGPVGVNNVPAGGNAVLMLNNELRLPLLKRVDGVLFFDVGNVYPTIKDFSLTDLRESGGVGIRLRTPWVLLRTDYGWVLDPRPGEKRSRFYLSIGQAF